MKHFLTILFFGILLFACKHDHKPASPELQKAYAIQQSALSLNKSLGENLPAELEIKRKAWLKSMIEIPGMDHDHSNCNHDHSRQTISITDSEMIAVQQAWSDSLSVIIELSKKAINE